MEKWLNIKVDGLLVNHSPRWGILAKHSLIFMFLIEKLQNDFESVISESLIICSQCATWKLLESEIRDLL